MLGRDREDICAFKFHGAAISQRRVPPLPVVEHLDVRKQIGCDIRPGLVVPPVNPFHLQRGKAALHEEAVDV